jgi:hypothetical protein
MYQKKTRRRPRPQPGQRKGWPMVPRHQPPLYELQFGVLNLSGESHRCKPHQVKPRIAEMVAIVPTTTDRTFIFSGLELSAYKADPAFADLLFREVDPSKSLRNLSSTFQHARIPSSFGDVSTVSFVSMAYVSGVAFSHLLIVGQTSIIMIQVAESNRIPCAATTVEPPKSKGCLGEQPLSRAQKNA